MGMRLELDSGFPQKLFVRYEDGFFLNYAFLPELSGNFKIFWLTVIYREIIILSPSLFFFLSLFFICIIY